MPIIWPVEVEERQGSGTLSRGDSAGHERLYIITLPEDATEQDAVWALQQTAPATYDGLAAESWEVEPTEDPGTWYGRVDYAKKTKAEDGETSFRFDTGGGTQHITAAKAHVQTYTAGGATAPDPKGGIGVTKSSVEGVDITVPVFNFEVTYYVDAASMTAAYIDGLYKLTGKTNNAQFSVTIDGVTQTWEAGEVLFLGASGSKRDSDDQWEINASFAASPNQTGLTIGDINGIAKKGWEYLWVYFEDTEDTSAKMLVKRPLAVYIERVYDPGDFGDLTPPT